MRILLLLLLFINISINIYSELVCTFEKDIGTIVAGGTFLGGVGEGVRFNPMLLSLRLAIMHPPLSKKSGPCIVLCHILRSYYDMHLFRFMQHKLSELFYQ